MTKLHELQMQPTINQVDVVLDVMVMHNEEGVLQPRGASPCRYWPHMVLLDSEVQPLMLIKVIVDDLGLIDFDLNPCPYQILTSMDGSKMAWRLTEQDVHVIQANPTKPMKYIIIYGFK